MVPLLSVRQPWILKTVKSCLSKNFFGDFGPASIASKRENRETCHSEYKKTDQRRSYADTGTSKPPCLREELLCPVTDPVVDGTSKVTIVGAGTVGIACANAILFQRISSHIALVDAFPKRLKGEGMEFNHALPLMGNPTVEYDTDFCISSNSKVIVITTGARPGKDESKAELVKRNAEIVKCIIFPLMEYSPKAVFVIVTYPVDVLSWLAWKVSGLSVNRIVGSGTHLDSTRFRCMIAQRLGIAADSVQALVIGEHGPSQVPLWSGASVAGVQLRDVLPNIGMATDEEEWDKIAKELVRVGSTVKCLKGYANTAIGLSVADIVKAILRNSQQVKTVSTLVQGHHDICQELFLSLPCVIGENGVSNVIRMHITEMEKKMLLASANEVHKAVKELKL